MEINKTKEIILMIYTFIAVVIIFVAVCFGLLTLGKLLHKECKFTNGDLICQEVQRG